MLLRWVEAGWYRIVKYDLPPGKSPWHLLYVRWFGSIYGVPWSDRGAPGLYNNQLISAENPIAVLSQLSEVVQQYHNPNKARLRNKAHKLPRKPITKELDITHTIHNLIEKATPETHIAELCNMAEIHELNEPTVT